MPEVFTFELGNRSISLEVGELAKQANGAVLVRYGDTVVLVTATMSKQPRADIDFFPSSSIMKKRCIRWENTWRMGTQRRQARRGSCFGRANDRQAFKAALS